MAKPLLATKGYASKPTLSRPLAGQVAVIEGRVTKRDPTWKEEKDHLAAILFLRPPLDPSL